MEKTLNLIGLRYGKLICLEKIIKYSKTNNKKLTYYLCQCDCGNQTIVNSSTLRKSFKPTRSCGCIRKENFEKTVSKTRKPIGEASFLRLFHSIKTKALLRNYKFCLTENDVKIITQESCHYCGILPYQKYGSKNCNGYYIYNGIDRKINNIGYTLENSIACCGICNKMKMDLDYDVFIKKCKLISEKLCLA